MGFGDFIQKIGQGFKKAASWVVDTAKSVYNKGYNAVASMFSWAGQQGAKVVDAVTAIPGQIIGTANNLVNTVGGIAKTGISTMGSLGNNLITTTGTVVDKGLTTVGSLLTSPIFLIGAAVGGFFLIQMITKK
jgi:hypothetical protein